MVDGDRHTIRTEIRTVPGGVELGREGRLPVVAAGRTTVLVSVSRAVPVHARRTLTRSTPADSIRELARWHLSIRDVQRTARRPDAQRLFHYVGLNACSERSDCHPPEVERRTESQRYNRVGTADEIWRPFVQF